jgi:cell division protein FtsL
VTTVETVLVIMLAIGFLVLLILSIIVASLMLGVMRNVKRISERAEEAAANVSDLTAMVGKRVAPIALSAAIAAAMRRFRSKKE